MSELGDYRLDRSPDVPPEGPGGVRSWRWLIWTAVVLLLGAGAVSLYFALRGPGDAASTTIADTATTEPVSPAPATAVEPARPANLPALAESDSFVRDLVGALSARPELARWLASDQLVRSFTAAVQNVADGNLPTRHVRAMVPSGSFRATRRGGRLVIDSSTYRRYDAAAQVVASLDPVACARIYRELEPLFADAYRELGYPDRRFEDTLARAITVLVETPLPDDPVPVSEAVLSYRYADERLESLRPVQKLLVRMGPQNARIVQDKLRAIAAELGLQIGTTTAPTR